MERTDQSLVADFVAESRDGLARAEEQLRVIGSSREIDRDVVDSVFRTMHSIKGTAGCLGLDRVESLAHGLEEMLGRLRSGQGAPSAELVRTMLRAADLMTVLIDAVETPTRRIAAQPIRILWARLPRMASSLAAKLGKHVRIEMHGEETQLDPAVFESIKDPLIHLVRNAVDHGIEERAARRAAGKPPGGRIILTAYAEARHVTIEVRDDGAGLDLVRIRQQAVERGLLESRDVGRISQREAAKLILQPGFSTADEVTNVSGRGVGLDVVKTNVERIGGTIEIHSETDRGTMVRITIPLPCTSAAREQLGR
jgi:chemotaxis protein histidine kinase CheA